jgi:pterin-4a-carbinolamine dehydratase
MNTQTAVEPKTMQYPPPAPQTPEGAVQRLKSERVQEALKAMPAWGLAHGEQAIASAKVFPTPDVAASYGAFVSRFASAAGYSVTVSLTGGQVCVTLYAPQVNGCPGELTESVLGFAKQLG